MRKMMYNNMTDSLSKMGIMSKAESASWIETSQSKTGFLEHENFLIAYNTFDNAVKDKKRSIQSPKTSKIVMLFAPFIDLKIRESDDRLKFSMLIKRILNDHEEFPVVKIGCFGSAQKQEDTSLRKEAEIALRSGDSDLRGTAESYLKFLAKRSR